jgi:hypothetical protein
MSRENAPEGAPMPNVGDRVIVPGTKLGQPTREGTLTGKVGSMIRVRWVDGTESLFTPGAGSVEYRPAGGSAAGLRRRGTNGSTKAKPAKKPAAKKAPVAKKKR